eukprot:scaffold44_cov339-Pavlova_lutheri.AAC.14
MGKIHTKDIPWYPYETFGNASTVALACFDHTTKGGMRAFTSTTETAQKRTTRCVQMQVLAGSFPSFSLVHARFYFDKHAVGLLRKRFTNCLFSTHAPSP